MDVEPNPGPQHINISDLPTPSKLLFNQAKRTRLKLTRYQSHTINLLAYTNNNLIPNGLTPKCTPAIHSNNPSFWNKWQENLDILAQLQLDLLLKETNNNVTQLQSTFLKQKEELRTSLNHDSTYAELVAIIETMAFKLQLNLDKLHDKKLNIMLQSKNNTTHPVPCIRQSTEANNLSNNELTIPLADNSPGSLLNQEPILQPISSDTVNNNIEFTNPEYPNITDEDGDVAQEFYLEFGGKMIQYVPKVFTTEQFLATLQQQKEESNSLTDAISDNKTPLTASPGHHERITIHPSSTNTPPHSQKKRKNRQTRSRKKTNISNPQPEDTVINLCNVQLSDAEIKLLSEV